MHFCVESACDMTTGDERVYLNAQAWGSVDA